jgi:pyroglutamyl-peptidase
VTDEQVVTGGPAAYFATLPVREMQKAIQDAGIPVELSLSAGAYLCNQVMYVLLHELAIKSLDIPAGFIHLPQLPEQASRQNPPAASMSLEAMVAGIRVGLATIRSA